MTQSIRTAIPTAHICAAVLAVFSGAHAGLALAAPAAPLDRFSVSAGAFYAEPEIQIDADTRYGRIDTRREKADQRVLPRGRAEFLIGDQHGVAVDYLRYAKKYDPVLTGNTVIDGQPVSGSASFDGKLRLDLSQVSYKWWVGEGNDVFGIGLGAAHYRAKIGGTATAQVQGTVNGVPQQRSVSATDSTQDSATAPVVELGWRHAFSPDVRMFVDASGIKKNGGKINGKIYRGAVGVEWFALKNVGLVLDYGTQIIDLQRDSERDANLRIKLSGPSAYVKVRF